MATFEQLRELARHAAHRTAPDNYTVDTNDAAFRGELAELCSSVNQFMKNKYDLYEIIMENADEIVPKNVIAALSPFAEVKTVKNGQKVMFKRSVGKQRAKKFLTQVGLQGVYETFRLDKETFEISTGAIGGGASIDLQRMIDGDESFADYMQIISDGLTEAVYGEVQKALIAAASHTGRPGANVVFSAGFDGDAMFRLCSVAKAYGEGAVIFAPPEFIGAMGPDAIVPIISGAAQGIYSPDDIEQIHRTGYVNIFRGTPIVQIPQSFVDENNDETYVNPGVAYVLPTGKSKVVQVVLEGGTEVHDYVNRDGSIELYAHKKVGVGISTYHDWCEFVNTNLVANGTWHPDNAYSL